VARETEALGEYLPSGILSITNIILPDLESNPVYLSERVDCGAALFPKDPQLIDGEYEGISGYAKFSSPILVILIHSSHRFSHY
jgi:hypothetical protein